MLIYTIAVTCAIAVSTVIMFVILNRLKTLSIKALLSITLASLISAISLPGIFNIVSANGNNVEFSTLVLTTAATSAIYILLAFILGVIISRIVPDIAVKPQISEARILEAILPEGRTTDENYLEQIFDNLGHVNEEETVNHLINEDTVENNLEKPVDSGENIDKMGLDNMVQQSENLTIDECIEEAFRLKVQDDAEGAILYYMYALDKKPQKGLTFWIVLDICVMYKTLGQCELALDILNSYYDIFRDIMDVSVREEIEGNLSNIQV